MTTAVNCQNQTTSSHSSPKIDWSIGSKLDVTLSNPSSWNIGTGHGDELARNFPNADLNRSKSWSQDFSAWKSSQVVSPEESAADGKQENSGKLKYTDHPENKVDREILEGKLINGASPEVLQIDGELREKLNDVQKENAILKRRVRRLREYIPINTKLETELDEMKKNNAELKLELESARSWLDEAGLKLIGKLKRANARIVDLNNENKMHVLWQKSEAYKLNSKISALEIRLASSQEERKKCEKQISELQTHIKELRKDIGAVTNTDNVDESKIVKAKITAKVSDVMGEKIKLKNLIKNMRTELQLQPENSSEMREDKLLVSPSVSGTTTPNEKRLSDIIQKLKNAGVGPDGKANGGSRATQSPRSSRIGRSGNTSAEVERYQVQLKDASLEKANLMSMVQNLRNEIKDSSLKKKDGWRQNDDVERIRSKLKGKLNTLSNKRKELEEETRNKDEKIAQLETGAISKIKGMEEKMKNHKQVENGLRLQLGNNMELIKKLENALQKIQSGKMELEEELQQTTQETKKLAEEKKNLTVSSGLLVNHLIKNITKNKSLETKLREAENKGENMEKQLSGAAARVEFLEQELRKEQERKLKGIQLAMQSPPVVLVASTPSPRNQIVRRHSERSQAPGIYRSDRVVATQVPYSGKYPVNKSIAAKPIQINRVDSQNYGNIQGGRVNMMQPGNISYMTPSVHRPFQQMRDRNVQISPTVGYKVARPNVIEYATSNYL